MNKGLRIGAPMLLTIIVLAGCTGGIGSQSKINPGPVGIGRSINELKGAPCACAEIEMKIPDEMRV